MARCKHMCLCHWLDIARKGQDPSGSCEMATACSPIHYSPPSFLRVLHLPLCKVLITDFHLIRQQVLKHFLSFPKIHCESWYKQQIKQKCSIAYHRLIRNQILSSKTSLEWKLHVFPRREKEGRRLRLSEALYALNDSTIDKWMLWGIVEI